MNVTSGHGHGLRPVYYHSPCVRDGSIRSVSPRVMSLSAKHSPVGREKRCVRVMVETPSTIEG